MENQNLIRRQNVLFLDSDYELVCILSSFLSLQKFKVAQSKKAREALFKMRNQNFDVVIMDPKTTDDRSFFNGISEFAHKLQKPEIIVMSDDLNYQLPENISLTLRAILPKPFELETFWNLLVGSKNAS